MLTPESTGDAVPTAGAQALGLAAVASVQRPQEKNPDESGPYVSLAEAQRFELWMQVLAHILP